MKKVIYFAAFVAAVMGCAKVETATDSLKTNDIAVSVTVDNGATKAVYDGENHIRFESGDAFYAAVAKKDKPKEGIYVATKQGAAASVYYSKFTIADAESATPEFKGNLYSITKADFADEYNFYGIFPTSIAYSPAYLEEDLTEWMVKIPEEQESSQNSWSPKAGAMVIQPVTISTSANTYDEKYEEYTTTQNEKLKFAHVFGYGKFTFAGIPDEYASLPVKQITIEAVGEKKDFVGSFEIDITRNVEEMSPVPYSTKPVLTLKADATIPVSDYVAWFVANPGMYDVRITVKTAKVDLIFERQGLNIRRGDIAAPTINFKETDLADSHDIALKGNETWAIAPFTSSNAITSTYKERPWGPEGKEMVFSLSYPESNNSNYGSSMYVSTGVYYQKLAGANIQGGKVVLSSAASFSGVKMVKVTLGNGTKDVTNDYTVSLVNGEDKYDLGKVTVTGVPTPFAPESFYFKAEDGKNSGDLVITADNFSNTNSMPYLVDLVLNPAPEIVCEDEIKLEKNAGNGMMDLNVFAADSDPEISVDADWIEISYSDGKLSYTYEENTGTKRTAVITVSATGLHNSVKQITVSQKSAVAIEYQLSFTAAEMYSFIAAEKARLESEGTTISQYSSYPVRATFTATATNDSGKTLEVPVIADKIVIYSSTEESFRSSSGSLKCEAPIGMITKMTASASHKFTTGNWANFAAKLSEDGNSWTTIADITSEGTEQPYLTTVTNDNDIYNYFDFKAGTSVDIYTIEVRFIAD